MLAWLSKENLKKENESLLIAEQNNVIKNNDIKAKIDYTQVLVMWRQRCNGL